MSHARVGIGALALTIVACPANEEQRRAARMLEAVQQTYRPVEPNRKIEDFTLRSHTGETFTQADLLGRWSLLFVGYTFCPDVCPMTLTTLAAALERLPVHDPLRKIQPVFVSVDPARDHDDRLSRYVSNFHPSLVGASGDKTQIDTLCRSIGAAYQKNGPSDLYYTVDHSTSLFLVNPQGELHGILLRPSKPETIVEDLRMATSDVASREEHASARFSRSWMD